MVYSRLQFKVLNIYKQLLRVAGEKPGMKEHIRAEFKKNKVIPRTDLLRIEHYVRRSERQLILLQKPTIHGMGQFSNE